MTQDEQFNELMEIAGTALRDGHNVIAVPAETVFESETS